LPVAGEKGDKGDAGTNGAKGDEGAAGTNGAKGDIGATGPVGTAGAKGAAGTPGQNGADGQNGVQGPAGPQGETGPQGPAGSTSRPYELVKENAKCAFRSEERLFRTEDSDHHTVEQCYQKCKQHSGCRHFSIGAVDASHPGVCMGCKSATWDEHAKFAAYDLVQGPAGTAGKDGAAETAGKDGQNGVQGPAGTAGKDGAAGTAGKDGVGVAVSHLAPVCEGSTAHLACKNGGSINIVSAFYGRTTDGSTCPHSAVSNQKFPSFRLRNTSNFFIH